MGNPARHTQISTVAERIAEIVFEARKLHLGSQVAFVKEAAAGDLELERQVLELLRNENFVEGPQGEKPRFPTSLTEPFASEMKPPEVAIGVRLGDFEVEKLLGQGGTATIYLANQISLGRKVALKISRNSDREARILAKLEHENIVKVFSEFVDPSRGIRILCMQYVGGLTLSAILDIFEFGRWLRLDGMALGEILDRERKNIGLENKDQKPEHWRRMDHIQLALWFGSRLADAVAYAHKAGVLHLDLKPSNIIIDLSGQLFLTDFNVSHDKVNETNKRPVIIGGTVNYMAPEQMAALSNPTEASFARQVGPHSDVYSLGRLLEELIYSSVRRDVKGGVIELAPESSEPGRLKDPVWKKVDESVSYLLSNILKRDIVSRHYTAGGLADAFETCLSLRAVTKRFAKERISSLETKFPYLTLSMHFFTPLAAGMLLVWLIATPTPLQNARTGVFSSFGLRVAISSALAFVGLLLFWLKKVHALRKYDSSDVESCETTGEQTRHHFVGLSERVFLSSTVYWLLLGIGLPLTWSWFGFGTLGTFISSYLQFDSPLLKSFTSLLVVEPAITNHLPVVRKTLVFAITVGLGSLSTSILLMSGFALQTIYLNLWIGYKTLAPSMTEELHSIRYRLFLYRFLAMLCPFVAAALIFFDAAVTGQARFIGLGICCAWGLWGALFAPRTEVRLAQILRL